MKVDEIIVIDYSKELYIFAQYKKFRPLERNKMADKSDFQQKSISLTDLRF